jgi:predicted Na+-dependent transporter
LMFRIKPQGTQPAWQGPAAAACFVLSVIACLSGSLLTTNAILNAHEHPKLYAIGLISLILALPIAMLGAHCLDLIERPPKRSDAA